MATNGIKRLPYGISDFRRIRTQNYYYVDKTQYIPKLEEAGSFLYLVRPRRFGKSLFLSMLFSYYDCKQSGDFDMLFDGLWIHDNPTAERNKYLVLYLDFSQVSGNIHDVQEKFEEYCSMKVRNFVYKYREFFRPNFDAELTQFKFGTSMFSYVVDTAKDLGLPMYLIVDEYDNFTNNILNAVGLKEYKDITHGVGFYRDTFKKFKGNFERILMLGVSPVTLEDLTSGYNIAQSITTDPEFNALLGFSEIDLREMIDYYREAGKITSSTDDIIEEMKPWYDNNCFSYRCLDEPKIFNSNMALHYLKSQVRFNRPPDNLLDPNVRTDYNKLKKLIEIDGTSFERKRIIQQIINDGFIYAELVESFPAERIGDFKNYVSLLFYYGMLTIVGKHKFAIPNHCIKDLYYSYLIDIYDTSSVIDMNQFHRGFNAMAREGNPMDFFNYVAEVFCKSTSVRTLIDGERAVQTFLLAYLKLTPYYITKVEGELNHGYADFILKPNPDYENVEHAYVIELKYIAKGNDTEALRKTKMNEAKAQLRKYMTDDELKTAYPNITWHAMALLFAGEEMIIGEM